MPSISALRVTPSLMVAVGLLLATGACASLGEPGRAVDMRVETQSPRGFTIGRPDVTLVGGELRLRGTVCRKPLSLRPQPHRLNVAILDAQSHVLSESAVGLGVLPVRRGARCVYYTALAPADLSMDLAVVRPAP